jgi:hypothetical protein
LTARTGTGQFSAVMQPPKPPDPKPPAPPPPPAKTGLDKRRVKEAAALRANLLRRKQQSRKED